MKQYRKKPIVIEAIQFDGWNWKECMQFMSDKDLAFTDDLTRKENLKIDTLEGTMIANVGDYILRGVKGEFYPCKPDVFAATYEPVEPTTNCSKLGSKFAIDKIKLTPTYFRTAVYKDGEHAGFINETTRTFDFDFMAAIHGFTPSELRELADLVEETLKKGGRND